MMFLRRKSELKGEKEVQSTDANGIKKANSAFSFDPSPTPVPLRASTMTTPAHHNPGIVTPNGQWMDLCGGLVLAHPTTVTCPNSMPKSNFRASWWSYPCAPNTGIHHFQVALFVATGGSLFVGREVGLARVTNDRDDLVRHRLYLISRSLCYSGEIIRNGYGESWPRCAPFTVTITLDTDKRMIRYAVNDKDAREPILGTSKYWMPGGLLFYVRLSHPSDSATVLSCGPGEPRPAAAALFNIIPPTPAPAPTAKNHAAGGHDEDDLFRVPTMTSVRTTGSNGSDASGRSHPGLKRCPSALSATSTMSNMSNRTRSACSVTPALSPLSPAHLTPDSSRSVSPVLSIYSSSERDVSSHHHTSRFSHPGSSPVLMSNIASSPNLVLGHGGRPATFAPAAAMRPPAVSVPPPQPVVHPAHDSQCPQMAILSQYSQATTFHRPYVPPPVDEGVDASIPVATLVHAPQSQPISRRSSLPEIEAISGTATPYMSGWGSSSGQYDNSDSSPTSVQRNANAQNRTQAQTQQQSSSYMPPAPSFANDDQPPAPSFHHPHDMYMDQHIPMATLTRSSNQNHAQQARPAATTHHQRPAHEFAHGEHFTSEGFDQKQTRTENQQHNTTAVPDYGPFGSPPSSPGTKGSPLSVAQLGGGFVDPPPCTPSAEDQPDSPFA